MQTFACDYDEMSFLWWYFKSDLICSGSIVKVFESDSSTYDVQILVDKVFKGEATDTLRLTVHSFHENGKTKSDCDVYMRANESWLIYSVKENGKYCSGGQESRSNRISSIKKYHTKDFDWLDSINLKVTDFFWNWDEWDTEPKPENINSIVDKYFNTSTVDTNSVHRNVAYVLCDVDKNGRLVKSNLFYYCKGFKAGSLKTTFEKNEYINPEVDCFTDFQKEAVRVSRMINNWIPTIFCGQNVKGQVLIKFVYENGKIQTEIENN